MLCFSRKRDFSTMGLWTWKKLSRIALQAWKLACRSSFRKTSQESRKWLISSTQCHPVLISLPLFSTSQKEFETNPNRDHKHTAVFANTTSWRKIIITSFTEITTVSATKVTKEKIFYSECYKNVLYAGPKSARNILTNLSPNPARPDLRLWCKWFLQMLLKTSKLK